MSSRTVVDIVKGQSTADGAGVRLMRSLGQVPARRLDPFLMLDEFSSDNPDDYIAGFPPHPHRGFETVTYMLEGHLLHEDHLGNRGDLRNGDVQWMTAARGIIHSEMPQQLQGRMHGFQLWINLPAGEKMKPASYRDIPAAQIPALQLANGAQVKVIAGTFAQDEQRAAGPVNGISTQPLFLDVQLPRGQTLQQPLPATHNAFIYVYAGKVEVDGRGNDAPHTALLLSTGDMLHATAVEDARFLLLAARPLHEPVVQYGPFVMNSHEEIEQALRDYQSGRFGTA